MGTKLQLLGHSVLKTILLIFFPVCRIFHVATAPGGSEPPHYRGLTVALRNTTVGMTPLDEWSDRRSDLYLTTHNTHNRQTLMPRVGFKLAIPVPERPQTHALDRAATWDRRCLVIGYRVLAVYRLTLNLGCFLPFHVLSKPPLTIHTNFRLCMLGSMESAV